MTRYLLDFAHSLELCSNNIPLRERIILDADSEFGVCAPTVGELWSDAYGSTRVQYNVRKILKHIRGFEYWDFDRRAAVEYGLIRVELHRKGYEVPIVAMQTAAIARRNRLILLTPQEHYSWISNLRIENWM